MDELSIFGDLTVLAGIAWGCKLLFDRLVRLAFALLALRRGRVGRRALEVLAYLQPAQPRKGKEP